MDTTDVVTDASANELALGYVNKVDQFFSYSFDGGQTSTPVSKELSGQSLADPEPYDGQLWGANFKNNSLFNGAPSKDDVFQGDVGDCYFLSRLSAMAKANPDSIRKMVVDLGEGTYAVRFYRNGQAEYVRVDADFYTTSPYGTTLTYAKLGQGGSIWAPVIEKAYAFWRTKQGDYPSINGGNGGLNKAHVSEELLGVLNPTITINSPVTPQEVSEWRKAGSPDGPVKDKIQAIIDWYNAGEPAGTMKNTIMTAVTDWLNAVKQALDDHKAVTVGHKSGVHNNMAIDFTTFRRGQHITTVDAVLTDANGNPIGIRLRDQYGQTNGNGYSKGYVDITDFTRIYFILGSAAAMNV
jgi:Calpain family cysteine protease